MIAKSCRKDSFGGKSLSPVVCVLTGNYTESIWRVPSSADQNNSCRSISCSGIPSYIGYLCRQSKSFFEIMLATRQEKSGHCRSEGVLWTDRRGPGCTLISLLRRSPFGTSLRRRPVSVSIPNAEAARLCWYWYQRKVNRAIISLFLLPSTCMHYFNYH